MITADKTFLRSHYKKKRFSLTKQEVDDLSQRVCKQLDKLNIWKLKHYHIFISISNYNELDTSFIINKLKSEQKIIIVPKISNNELVHIAINDETELKDFVTSCTDLGVKPALVIGGNSALVFEECVPFRTDSLASCC